MEKTADEITPELLFTELGLRNLGRMTLPQHIKFTGFFIITLSSVLLLLFIYGAFGSKLLPESGNPFLDAIKYDFYFCYLLPLSILPTLLIIYLNWLAMKHFEQNLALD